MADDTQTSPPAVEGAADKRTLLTLAVDIHQDLGALATGLAHAGASPQAVAGLQRIASMIGDIVKVLGNGPVGNEPAQPGAAPVPAEAQHAPPTGPAPQAGPPQGTLPGERPNGLHEATAQLQAALASKHAAAQRALNQ